MRRRRKSCPCGHPFDWHDERGCRHGRDTVTGGCGCDRVFGARKSGSTKTRDLLVAATFKTEDLLQGLDAVISGLQRMRLAITGPTASVKKPSAAAPAENVTRETRDHVARIDKVFGPAKLARGERRILFALRMCGELARDELAFRTLQSPVSSGYRNCLSNLRVLELIEGRDRFKLTELGNAEELVGEALPIGTELRQAWRLKVRGKCERALFDVAAASYSPIPRAELAERAGYQATSSGYRNALSRLRTLRLVTGKKEIAMTEAFIDAVGVRP